VAILVALVFAVLLASVVQLRGDTVSGQRTTNLVTAATNAEISVLDVETGLRGYLLTREARFLQPYRDAQAMIDAQLEAMSRNAVGRDEQRRVAALVGGVEGYLAGYASPTIAAGPRVSQPRLVGLITRGKVLVDALRSQFQALISEELAERRQRRATLSGDSSRTIVLAAVGLASSVLLLVALCVYVLRQILRPARRVAEAAERLAAGDLTVRVPEVGRGEVIDLGRSFNAMATALETRNVELLDANRRLEHAVEVAEDASRMKSNFLANMSHEIRTPLNGVVGMVDLLADTELSSEQREYVDTARASSETLMTVVNDVLDVSKIEAGRLELEHRDFDLHQLIATTCAMLAAEASAKGVRLQVRVGEGVPRAVRGDRLRIGQILANLVSNAVKFTAEGEVAVQVADGGVHGGVSDVRFEVRDSGIGIAPERVARLFDPFTQAEVGTTRRFGGTGLGLTICRELVGLMGGTIGAESELGRGSTFRFTLPLARAAQQLAPQAPIVELRGLRVLVTDDNPANRRIVEAFVASWGMRPSAAVDAGDALAQLTAAVDAGEPFDVALLDYHMPGESGLELARRITGSPKLRGTRLIMLASSEGQGEELERSGIRQRLAKPVRQGALLEALMRSMQRGQRGGAGPAAPGAAPAGAAPAGPSPAGAAPAGPAPAGAASAAAGATARAASGTAAAPAERGSRTRRAGTARGGCRILVAEDNATNRLYVDRLLTRSGHRVGVAVDGQEALAMYESDPYDLILMDCQMPELDGYDATREIRRREADRDGAHIPIIAMTAGAMDGARQRCLEAGMDDYVAKPFGQQELEHVISRWAPDPGPVLDSARMAELRDLFPGDEAGAMMRELAATIAADLERVERALADVDANALKSAAHAVAGSAQLVGAGALVGAAGEIERHPAECVAMHEGAALALLRRRGAAALAALEEEGRRPSPPVDESPRAAPAADGSPRPAAGARREPSEQAER
jgi:signal transduction histidine kinase/CheY-like chemotaxis protein